MGQRSFAPAITILARDNLMKIHTLKQWLSLLLCLQLLPFFMSPPRVLAEIHSPDEVAVKDIWGRSLLDTPIVLVDWEGYIANPAIKLFVVPPANAVLPVATTLRANGVRLYFDLPGQVGPNGPSKSLFFTNRSPIPFYLSLFPDRDSLDEAYALTITFIDGQNTQSTTTVDIHVLDQDKPDQNQEDSEAIQIAVEFSQDQTGLFGDPLKQAIVQQVAADWAYFFDNMQLDSVSAGMEQTFIWHPDGFNSGIWFANARPYTGYLLYAYGNQNSELRSGGQPSLHAFQTRSGLQLPLRRSGGIQMHTAGNYNTLGWFLTTGDDDWWVSGNLGDEKNDFYSIVHHEMGHALFFNPGYPGFDQAKTAGQITDPVVFAYQGVMPQIDPFDHFAGEVDKVSQRGAFGNEYFGNVPQRRWLITKLDLLMAQAIGYNLRQTSPFAPVSASGSHLSLAGIGEPYRFTPQASGGIPFYNWTIDAGGLPAGIALDPFTGTLSGIPSAPGTYPITLRVQDYDQASPGVPIQHSIIVVNDLTKLFLPLITAN